MITKRKTDHRNRNLAKLHEDVCFGRSEGQIIWQPRILCWQKDKEFAGEKLPEPYEGMTTPEIYRELGCSARIYDYNGSFYIVEDASIKRSTEHKGNIIEYHIETPVGRVTSIHEQTPNSHKAIIRKWWAETKEDLKVLTYVAKNSDWAWNQTHYDKMKETWGDLGAPTVFLPRVNIQNLYLDAMGVENAVYALMDFPEEVESYFEAVDDNVNRLIDLINPSPIKIINFGDNLHCGTLPPYYFEKYVQPAYLKRCEKLHSAGKFVYAHWDGNTKSLLPYAQNCGLDGIEAITPLPQGDVTIEEIKEALGDDMFLIDGIAAVLFDDIYPEGQLIEQTEKLIELFGEKLILGISDEISSTGNIERVKTVGRIVDDYNAKMAALGK